MRVVEWVLSQIGNREDIVTDGDLYLRRWRLFGFNAKLPYLFGRSVMLHRIVRPDGDRDPHNHPWDFWTLVLRRSYIECVYVKPELTRGRVDADDVKVLNYRRFGALDWRPAEHMHRIDKLPNGEAWTLVVTKQRPDHKWGFWTEQGWVYWKWYIAHKQSQGFSTTASKSAS